MQCRRLPAKFAAAVFLLKALNLQVEAVDDACAAGIDQDCRHHPWADDDMSVSDEQKELIQRAAVSDSIVGADSIEEAVGEAILAGVELKIHADSDVARTGRGEWIISLPEENCKKEDLEALAQNMPKGTRAEFRGHPENGGLCIFIMEGTREGVLEELRSHHWKATPKVETDTTGFLLDDLDQGEAHTVASDAAEALYERDDVPWGLDRIDDRTGLDGRFHPMGDAGGAGVHVYVFDTGIRTSHAEFGGRATPMLEVLGHGLKECIAEGHVDQDCAADHQGHGTFCAAVIGGRNFGVAPQARLHAVKVVDSDHSSKAVWILEAFDYVFFLKDYARNIVISLSLELQRQSSSLRSAMQKLTRDGFTVVTAAGNQGGDACKQWPARSRDAITVAAMTTSDARWESSNFGVCVDLFAPGENVLSAWADSDNATRTSSGTSAACPHVAGAVALLISEAEANKRLVQAKGLLLAHATVNAVTDAGRRTPNRLLYIGTEVQWLERSRYVSTSWREIRPSGAGARRKRTLWGHDSQRRGEQNTKTVLR